MGSGVEVCFSFAGPFSNSQPKLRVWNLGPVCRVLPPVHTSMGAHDVEKNDFQHVILGTQGRHM